MNYINRITIVLSMLPLFFCAGLTVGQAENCPGRMLSQTAACTMPVGGNNGCEIWNMGYQYATKGYKIKSVRHTDNSFTVVIQWFKDSNEKTCEITQTHNYGSSGWKIQSTWIIRNGTELKVKDRKSVV